MTYASFDDVAVYVPDLDDDPETEVKVEDLLEQAEAEILLTFPDLDARVADGRSKLVLVKRVEAEMVSSVLRNPAARTSESSTVGGLSSSTGFNVTVASGLLAMTPAQIRMIAGSSASTAPAAGGYVVSLWGP